MNLGRQINPCSGMAAGPTIWAVLAARCDAVSEWNHRVYVCVYLCVACLFEASFACGRGVSAKFAWTSTSLSLLSGVCGRIWALPVGTGHTHDDHLCVF
jgi:hypothetical protein